MGYCSDVRFNTNRAGYQEFLSYLPDEFKDPDKWGLFGADGRSEYWNEDDDSIIFGWDGIKWYTDWDSGHQFDEVKAVMAAFERVCENGEHPIEYLRTGEDDFDVDHLGETSTETEELTRFLGTMTSICIW